MKSLTFILSFFACSFAFSQFSSFVDISKNISNSVLEVADIDNDSDIDIILLSKGTNKLHVYLNNGSGQFSVAQTISISTPSTSKIIIGDVDNDGWKDVVTLSNSVGVKLVLFRNNAGTLGAIENIHTFSNFLRVDFCFTKRNSDTFPEIALDYEGYGSVYILDNNAGVFTIGPTVNGALEVFGSDNYAHIESVDMDNDGDQDLITNRLDASSAAPAFPIYNVWFENNGGVYIKHEYYIHINAGASIKTTMSDITGDTLPEYIILNTTGESIHWFNNQSAPYTIVDGYGSGTAVTTPYTGLDFLHQGELITVDFNNDGAKDILINDFTKIYLYLNNGSNSAFTQIILYNDNNSVGAGDFEQFHYRSTDINSDGLVDLVVTNLFDDDIFWLQNNGNLTVTQKMIDYNASTPMGIHVIDYNNDGLNDVLSCFYRKNGLHKFEGTTPGSFTTNKIVNTSSVSNFNKSAIQEIDMDEDGDQDVIITYDEFPNSNVLWYENTPLNPFTISHSLATPLPFLKIITEDMNNDGKKDLILRTSSNVSIRYNLGSGNFGAPVIITSTSYNNIYVSDLDGDNLKDIILVTETTSVSVKSIKNLGLQNFGPISPVMFSTASIYLGFGDVDGDGLTDCLGSRSGTGIWSSNWYKNNGNFNFGTANQIANQTGVTFKYGFVEDFDLDGDNDIVVVSKFNNTGNYQWTIKWFENNGSQGFISHLIAANLVNLTEFKISDIDNDGDKDLIATMEVDKVGYYRNDVLAPHTISGNIFVDINSNGIKDLNDPGYDYGTVDLSPDGIVGFTNYEGKYIFSVDEGNYTVGVNGVDPNLWQMTSDSVSYSIDIQTNTPNVTGKDFGFHPIIDSTLLMNDIASSPIGCDLELQQFLTVRNIGGTFPFGIVTYEFDTLVSITNVSPAYDSLVGNKMFWHFDSLFFFEEFNATIHFQTPDFTAMGSLFSFHLSTQTYDSINQPLYLFEDSFNSVLTCAYDPNNKVPEPAGYTNEGFIMASQEYLDYTVNFQNTGTDTAAHVIIKDQLSTFLNPSSLIILSSSHHVESYLSSQQQITFKFNNIMLPDSNVNLQGSKGYVKYRIKLDSNLAPGTVINNYGAIYFDQNPAILTNTTKHTIFDCDWIEGYTINLATTCVTDSTEIIATGQYVENVQWSVDSIPTSALMQFSHPFTSSGNYSIQMHMDNPICSHDTLLVISINDYPTITITPGDDLVICETDSVLLNSNVGNSVWSKNDLIVSTDSTFLAIDPGQYTVTSSSGTCTSSDTVVIAHQLMPNPNIVSNTQEFYLCNGSAIELTSDSIHGNEWIFNAVIIDTNQTTTANSEGWYYLKVDGGSCPDVTDSIQVLNFVPNIADILIPSDSTICEGSSITLSTANIFGSFNWYLNNQIVGNSNQYTANNAGWYFLEFTDTVCFSSLDSVQINVETAPISNISSLSNGHCLNDSTLLWSSSTNAQIWRINGSIIGQNDSVYVGLEGWYELEVPGNYCPAAFDSIFIEVDQPVTASIAFSNNYICPNEIIQLTSLSSNNSWSFNDLIIGQNNSITIQDSGWYFLQVDGGYCFSAIDSVFITEISAVNAQIDYSTLMLCPNESIQLSSQGINNSWSQNGVVIDQSPSIQIQNEGWYILEVDGGICSSDLDSVFITEIAAVNAQIEYSSSAICPNDSILLSTVSSTSNWIYNGSLYSQSPSIYVSQTGWYILEVTNTICPSDFDTLEVLMHTMPNGPFIIYSNGILFVNNPEIVSCEWYFESGPLLSTNDTLNLLSEGEYTVIMTFNNGCILQENYYFSTIGLEEGIESDFIVYPIPVMNELTINGKSNKMNKLVVTNELGVLVLTHTFIASETIKLDIHHLSSGIYYIDVHEENNRFVHHLKFIKL